MAANNLHTQSASSLCCSHLTAVGSWNCGFKTSFSVQQCSGLEASFHPAGKPNLLFSRVHNSLATERTVIVFEESFLLCFCIHTDSLLRRHFFFFSGGKKARLFKKEKKNYSQPLDPTKLWHSLKNHLCFEDISKNANCTSGILCVFIFVWTDYLLLKVSFFSPRKKKQQFSICNTHASTPFQ